MKKIYVLASLVFTINAFAQIPNNGFENWTTTGSYENPTSWASANSSCGGPFFPCTKSTNHYPSSVGVYSVKLQNKRELLPSCGLGLLDPAGTYPNDKFQITGHPTSLTGYYLFQPLSGDTMDILILLYNAGVQQASANFSTTVGSFSWTPFNIAIPTYTTADSASIFMAAYYLSPNPGHIPQDSSILYVDNLNFNTLITGIEQIPDNNELINIYPNPNSGSFVIEPSSATKQTMQVYDVNGKLVLNQTITGKTTIDASTLNEGVYNISLLSNESVINKRLVIVR